MMRIIECRSWLRENRVYTTLKRVGTSYIQLESQSRDSDSKEMNFWVKCSTEYVQDTRRFSFFFSLPCSRSYRASLYCLGGFFYQKKKSTKAKRPKEAIFKGFRLFCSHLSFEGGFFYLYPPLFPLFLLNFTSKRK